jgi:protein-L-isoaspartate(D-aspartate) O-methyltransferase
MDVKKQKLIEKWTKSGLISDSEVISAFKKVKREKFLHNHEEKAYEDIPLPIMHSQTISQPSTVVIMLQALELKEGMKVLEIGSGSGYNAALISEIIFPGKLFTTEIIPEVYEFAKNNLKSYENIRVVNSDGSFGYEKASPFDRIIVTCACSEVPRKLLHQLKDNGILLVPVGSKYSQEMLKITKKNDKLKIENLGNFVFVPLTH